MEYVGEHLLPGALGRICIVLAMGTALFSFIGFFIADKKKDLGLQKWAAWSFRIHALAILGICVTLFTLLFLGYTEYDYVWKHSNSSMPLRYLLSCFWEGQEGSFLLWMFWHAVLGMVVLHGKNHAWKAPILWVISLVQVFLVTMVLGIYIGDLKIGSDPFILIRELPENLSLPWTQLADYLTRIPQFADGRGLNPLLQNYWMTIHPPILFLGFASTLIPFAIMVSGFQKRSIEGAFKVVLSWAFFSVGVLGLGILMGGAWAYEALSFGGFWAWDPVENASLVPWLFMVSGAHLALVAKNRKKYYFTGAFLLVLSFVLVLYSTFLTRSGILGDTSVHSFTGDGMIGQLLMYLLFFVLLAFVFLSKISKLRLIYVLGSIILGFGTASVWGPEKGIIAFLLGTATYAIIVYQKEYRRSDDDTVWSREFWMFVGSMVITLSALQITLSTSIPVFNALLKPFSPWLTGLGESTGWSFIQELAKAGFAPPANAIAHYNKWQIPFAAIVSVLVGCTQLMNYSKTPKKAFANKVWTALIITGVVAGLWLIISSFKWSNFGWVVLLVSSLLAVIGNAVYWAKTKANWKKSGASIAHMGFGLLLFGAFISTSQSEKISANTSGWDIRQLSADFQNDEDVLLFKGDTALMGRYFISYRGKEAEKGNVFYNIDYFETANSSFQQGQVVIWEGMFFECMVDHVSDGNFIDEQPKVWRMLEPTETESVSDVQPWKGQVVGELAFSLRPKIQLNPTFGNVPEPDTKHWIHQDLYTHIRWAELEEATGDEDGFKPAAEYKIKAGDTLFFSNKYAVFSGLGSVTDKAENGLLESDIAAFARLLVHSETTDSIKVMEPLFILRDSTLVVPDVVEDAQLGLRVKIENLHPETKEVTFLVSEHKSNAKEFIVMQAVLFPFINLLWLGCVVMVIGCIISMFNRRKQVR
ncbi:MAG: cytochrome c-type biogenesis protein CcmF [Luteibaculaceae bacterium]|jgi:cytochrome c-type biogenesis protein CcmF